MPRTLPDIEYARGDLVRKVQQGGWISLHGHNVRVSTALVGQPVAMRARADLDGTYDIFFCHHRIDEVNLCQASQP